MDNNTTTQVISLDLQKVWYETIDNKKVVHKKTSYNEIKNLTKAQEFLKDKSIIVNDTKYSIKVPEIYSWDENTNVLTMSFCSGKNLELMLRNKDERATAIPFLQKMMGFVIKKHFYWQDFAPRNIIIDSNTIYLIDFEKALTFEVDNLLNFLRPHVFEEYSSFLLPSERLITTEQVFSPSNGDKNMRISIDAIKVKRVKSIATALGYKSYISREQYLNIQSMIMKAEEPFETETGIVFPRVHLVEMLENKAIDPSVYYNYSLEILSRNNISINTLTNNEEERF